MGAPLGQAIRKARREYKEKLLARLEQLVEILKPADPDVTAEGDYVMFDLETTPEQTRSLLDLGLQQTGSSRWGLHAPFAADQIIEGVECAL